MNSAARHNAAPQTDTHELEISLKAAHAYVGKLYNNPQFQTLIQDEAQKLAQRGTKMDQPRFFRHAADWAARKHFPNLEKQGELSREQLLAQAIFSTPDAVITTRTLPRLEANQYNSRQDALVFGYARERVARFDSLLHQAADAYPDLKPAELLMELKSGYAVTNRKQSSDLHNATRILKDNVERTQSEFVLADLLSQDPNIQLEWGTTEQRSVGAALIAHITTARQRSNGSPQILTVGIQPHPTVEAIDDIRKLAGQESDPLNPCFVRLGFWNEKGRQQPYVRADMFSMVATPELADDWHSSQKLIEDRWLGASASLMRGTVAARLDHYSD